MTLPPLPLIDGVLFMDNSGWLESMQTCDRYLEYKALHRRIESGEKAALNFGSAIHLALEHRYRKYGTEFLPDTYYAEVAKILTSFFDEHPVPADDFRNLNWADTVIRKHNEKYEIEEFALLGDPDTNKPMVELSFSVPLFTWKGRLDDKDVVIPIIYTGRIDLPVVLDGQLYVMDHKTTSMLGAQFFERMKMSSQPKGYCWAMQKATGKQVAGYVVNAIRTKQPPLYVTEGRTSSKGKNQSPETWWNESLQRERYHLQPNELEEWEQNTIALVNQFFKNYQAGYFPMKTTQCTNFGRCPYYDVCSLASEDRGVMLNSGRFTENVWTPLQSPTQPKATV